LKVGIKEIIKTKNRTTTMTNGNPTLIAGFEDVMQHIRNQEKRIQDLEKKIEKQNYIIERHNKANDDLMEINMEAKKIFQKRIDTLLSKKWELEAKEDEAKVVFKENRKYREEMDMIKQKCEEECEAAGILEVMQSRIEDAEKQVEEYKLKYEEQIEKTNETRKRANEQTHTLITQETIIKNLIQTLIVNDKQNDLVEDGIELITDWYLYGTGETYQNILDGVIDDMNENDWNEDENRTKIIYDGKRIRLELNDTSSEEETDEDA